MAKFKPCNYDQMVMLPISLENQLVPGSLEHTINELVEKHIKLSVFDERYSNDETGASAIHPKVLLKIVAHLLKVCNSITLDVWNFQLLTCSIMPVA